MFKLVYSLFFCCFFLSSRLFTFLLAPFLLATQTSSLCPGLTLPSIGLFNSITVFNDLLNLRLLKLEAFALPFLPLLPLPWSPVAPSFHISTHLLDSAICALICIVSQMKSVTRPNLAKSFTHTSDVPHNSSIFCFSLFHFLLIFFSRSPLSAQSACVQTMSSSSPPQSPTIARRQRIRGNRVSFGTGIASSKVPDFFSQLAAASAATIPVAPKAPSRQERHNTHHGHGHSHSHSHSQEAHIYKASHVDRRACVEDVDDEDDASSGRAGKAISNNSNTSGRAKSVPLGGPVLDPSLPTITASAAAAGFPDVAGGPPGFGGHPGFRGINPAVGANPIFTHLNNGNLPHQPYAVQAFPTFLPATNMAAAQGYNIAATATHAVNGVDPTAITGLSFLPAVPDATNGPMLHTYVPRNDAPGQAGIVYMQQPQQQAMYTTVSLQPYQLHAPLSYHISSVASPSSVPSMYPRPNPQYYNASASILSHIIQSSPSWKVGTALRSCHFFFVLSASAWILLQTLGYLDYTGYN